MLYRGEFFMLETKDNELKGEHGGSDYQVGSWWFLMEKCLKNCNFLFFDAISNFWWKNVSKIANFKVEGVDDFWWKNVSKLANFKVDSDYQEKNEAQVSSLVKQAVDEVWQKMEMEMKRFVEKEMVWQTLQQLVAMEMV